MIHLLSRSLASHHQARDLFCCRAFRERLYSRIMSFYTTKFSQGGAALAPMAGYTDAPFRQLCREFGSSWAVTEMVSARALVRGDLQGVDIGEPYPGEPDLVIQVFGGDPAEVAAGGRILYDLYQPSALDINMGCPVKKVTGKSCGSKLMLEPARAADIVRHLKASVPVPVSAKMRLGYDERNVIEVAQALSEAGADLLAVHGRTAKQRYTGEADWNAIREVADAVPVPVVGSGDVRTPEQVQRYRDWGLGVMIARGAVGRPWIFREVGGGLPLSRAEGLRTAYRHAELHCAWYAARGRRTRRTFSAAEREAHALRSLRAQLTAYFSLYKGARARVIRLETLSELRELIEALGVQLSPDSARQTYTPQPQPLLSPQLTPPGRGGR